MRYAGMKILRLSADMSLLTRCVRVLLRGLVTIPTGTCSVCRAYPRIRRSALRSGRFAAKATPTIRGFDKNISRRSGLAREFGGRPYALEGSRPRPLLRSAASIKTISRRSGLAREFGVRPCALECSRPRPLLRSAASIDSCTGLSRESPALLGRLAIGFHRRAGTGEVLVPVDVVDSPDDGPVLVLTQPGQREKSLLLGIGFRPLAVQ